MQGFELVLGADICYGLKALPFIFGTYAALLSPSPRALGLLGYVSRHVPLCPRNCLCLSTFSDSSLDTWTEKPVTSSMTRTVLRDVESLAGQRQSTEAC